MQDKVLKEAREVFDKIVSETKDPDRKATLELLREYYTNHEFKKRFEDFVYQMNQKEVK